MSKKSLQKQIQSKLNKLQELIEEITEAQVIDPDDPTTWDPDTLYNLTEELKEMLELLENKEQGLLTLISDWETESEQEEEND